MRSLNCWTKVYRAAVLDLKIEFPWMQQLMLLSQAAVSSHSVKKCLTKHLPPAAVADASLCVFSVSIFLFLFFCCECEIWNRVFPAWHQPLLLTRCLLFPGASRAFSRARPCCPCCRRSRSQLTFHSPSRQPSGPSPSPQTPCLGEARISRVFYQGQAKELQDPGCRSKRINFQSDWPGPLGTPEQKWHSGTGSWPCGSGWCKPSS